MPAIGPAADSTTRYGHRSSISVYLNGTRHTVKCDSERYNAGSTLSEYIRDVGLTSVKTTCQEGGCGACAVAITIPDITGGGSVLTTQSINSCLCPLFSVDGWQISTAEGLGTQKTGFHPIQQRVAKFNGSQCGYCTPGMVMNMYGLLHKNPQPSEREVEDNFDGNLCRCTGYRAILDAMKSFCVDSSIPDGGVIDIEDLNKNLCKRTGLPCSSNCDHANGDFANGTSASGVSAIGTGAAGDANGSNPDQSSIGCVKQLSLRLTDALWFRPTSLSELGELLRTHRDSQVKMVVGNTASGIYKDEDAVDVYLDIKYVKELSETKVTESGISLGANTSLSDLITRLQSLQDTQTGFAYFSSLRQHLKLVGNILVRNVGSIGGNLLIKYAHPDFPSDVFTILEAAGATVEIYDSADESQSGMSLLDFATKIDMQGKVLKAVHLKSLDANDRFTSYKVTPRVQNAHAYVNAAFRFKVTEDGKQILGRPALVYGGIDEKTIHADMTEQFLAGKEITTAAVKDAVLVLKSELSPSASPLLSSPEYRQDLAANLLYKTLLSLHNTLDPRLESGGTSISRPLSSAIQTFQEKTEEQPLKQPMPKVTSLLQASGEAQFVNDMPRFQRELCAAFVLSTVANAQLQSVDPSPALALAGVHRFISSSDIGDRGRNQMHVHTSFDRFTPEELFSTGKINYAGQPIGLILAESESLANRATQLVRVQYTDMQPPILTIQQGIQAGSFHPLPFKPVVVGQPDDALKKAKNIIEGQVTMGTQYHFYLENQVSLCVPSEDGIDVYSAVQYADILHSSVAAVLGKPVNYVNVHVPRLGGAFGGKAMTSCVVASAAAVAANVTGRPVRLNMSLSSNMALAGKRFPILAKYKVGFSDEGVLEVVQVDVYVDAGNTESNNFLLRFLIENMDHGYYCPNWKMTPHFVRTHKPTNVACRGPGHVPASLIIETIMEHVAKAVNKHPIMVKEINLYQEHQTDIGFGGHVLTYCTMRDVWKQLKDLAEVEKRLADVQVFNTANKWKKRGLTMSAVKHGIFWAGTGYPAQVSVFAQDGTVTVSQSGVEMGQGLYTKVTQAVAHALGIPLHMIKVRPNQSIIANNAFETGGSSVSEQCVYAVLECCKILRERMTTIKNKYPDADWVTLCRKALENKIDLGARYTNFGEPGSPFFNYFTYCAGVYETELDVLTGEYQICRVDIMYDCGESLNPMIDIGQIEGAFVFGLGCHLLENVVYDPNTGRVLNDGTWEYKPPSSKDIPIDWRIHLLPDAPNPVGVRGSKAVGEPPLALACGPMLALKQCMEAAREDLTGSSPYIPVDSPLTVEKLQQGCMVTVEHMEI